MDVSGIAVDCVLYYRSQGRKYRMIATFRFMVKTRCMVGQTTAGAEDREGEKIFL